MASYIVRRFLLALLVVWGAVTIMFLLFFVIPGNTLDLLGGGEKAVSAEVRHNQEARYGLDKSVIVQYGNYWKGFSHWDLGRSVQDGKSVNALLKARAANSARLAFWGLSIEVLFGVGVGVLAAVRRYSAADYFSGVVAVALTGIPVFVMGYLLQYLFGILPGPNHLHLPQWARFPVQSIGPNKWFGVIPLGHQWKYLILPAFTLAFVNTGFITRLTRTSMLEVLRADYMRTAKAKGLSRRRIVFKHALRNSLIPVITQIGYDVIALFGIAVLTETVYNWPGIGSTIRDYTFSQDVPVVLGLGFAVILAASLTSLVVDIGYSVLDPRIRLTTEAVG